MNASDETEQTRLLRRAGVRSASMLKLLKDHDLTFVKHAIEHNQGHPGLLAVKLLHGDWSSYEPQPKIFSAASLCPVCHGPLNQCHGIHA